MKNKNKQVKIMDKKVDTEQLLISEIQEQHKNGASKNGSGVVNQNGGGQNSVNKNVQNDKNENVINKSEKNDDKKVVKKGKTLCQACKKKCSGEVLRVHDKYFHTECFRCVVCSSSLAQGGFFSKDGSYYCTADYQRNFGTKCSTCGDYVEGEVVTALGKTYHQKCFLCGRCRQPFPTGEKVTYTGKEVLCQKCVQIPVRDNTPQSPTTNNSNGRHNNSSPQTSPTTNNPNVEYYAVQTYDLNKTNNTPMNKQKTSECAGCKEELKEGQALIALERQWHIWCFKCGTCGSVLHGEYMGRDGIPYCERDYQKQFGVKCAYCTRYISGKVLQAGDNHHFHPTCARCTKCGDPFGDGEEMYLQGGAIWHPRCGPGPTENGTVLNGNSGAETNGHMTDTESRGYTSGREFDRMSSSGVSELQFSMRSRTPSLTGSLYSPPSRRSMKHSYRTPSPGLILREYNKGGHEDISRIYTYSYLTEEPSQGYLRRPIDPYDKVPISPHFHRPSSQHSMRGSQSAGGRLSFTSKSGKSGMKVMVEQMRSETPRPKSPGMNNEEPIELSHYPDAKKPKPGTTAKIDRDDFPAPPYPYTDPERRRRWSDTFKGVPDSDSGDDVDGNLSPKEIEDLKLKKEEEELSKISTGIGKVFLKEVKEREKIKKWKAAHLDPRNASRTPSANKEPTYRLRYENPIGASPSRNLDHPKPFDEDEYDRSVSCRSTSLGRSSGQHVPSYNVVSSLRNVPRPGYGLQSSTLPAAGRNGVINGYADYSFSGLGDKTHSTDFSSGKSDISTGSNTDGERRAMNVEMPVSTTYTGGLGGYVGSYVTHMRRSLPNMAHSMLINEPAKIYPYHLLLITNYRLPIDVDRCNLERHLSDAEFEAIFQCQRADFYRLPQWRRNELKRRARLF